MNEVLAKIKGGLVVSCQASAGEPLCSPDHILALALSALNGGAVGLRLEGAENIAAVRSKTTVPIIGLTKSDLVPDDQKLNSVYITPTFADASAIAQAGCDIIALDATSRTRPDGVSLTDLVSRIHSELNKPIWADVATLDEGLAAVEAGVDVVSTTLSGYTKETASDPESGPDMSLLRELITKQKLPVVLEGRVWNPSEVTEAFKLGAFAVVVGSAITRPQLITRRFVKAVASGKS